ncbi:valine--tRNA ligase [Sedimentibacter hydroxybenzoicus DSM 7310]|uniref:Valine--tRNA ligase n=1 Tax=Sedimentibacter hydroxybenzoicus DSM 7310 TaxID=1123245 RepID=A0A974BKN2_SEDHY|nr:valine--tRNA ligase [Sedimentibacter hydroxybenzoicus]NYB74621.1 valine--tRNA ligase [Sedimentibacter hydroxybenzoicus DSM 7310]
MEKRYNFTQIEKQMQEFWEQKQIYKFNPDAKGQVYSIDTPPPTVSGSLHIGHLFSYTQAEMAARFRRMQGQNVFYPFGFDDNGLPTERLVEREEGIRANALPRSEFIEKCRRTTEKYENEFKTFWNSLGFSVDWASEYQTISPEVQKISQELFLELVKMGKAYTKESPVLWCTECRTSIAQAELDTTDIESTFNYVPFYVDGYPLEVATTRPELLYGCVCLFVNPSDERYQQYIGKSAVVPLYDYEIPIYTDEKVCIDKGTGVVMCATFGDSTDAEWYDEHSLPYRKVILPDGSIDNDVPHIGGLSISDARKTIIRLLDEHRLLFKSETITHAVGTHERCGKPVEIIPSRQWYIDILSERERFLKAADEINWYPSNMKSRYIAWVENLKWDWCISRQRYFGVPFPVWYCKNCGEPVFAEKDQLPVNPLETEYKGICRCGCPEFIPESAVFDTWATSSITPQINERLGLKLTPMSMRTHAHEIIRTWTFYTIVRSLYHTGEIPWNDLMICGFILARKGEKISKSKSNNELDPKYLISAHSADVLRYWTAGARLGTDTFFSPDELEVSKRFITKLWNASKFAISHLQDIDTEQTPDLLPVDRWIIERVNETAANAARLLYEYEIGSAKHEIDNLFWKDFCDNYIEIVKERLYKPDIHGAEERKSGQYALYYALLNIMKLYAIYVPHITEYIYQEYFLQYEKKVSIHLTHWVKPSQIDNEIILFGENLKNIIFEMRKYKSERNLSMRTEMDFLNIHTDRCFEEWFILTEKDIKACTRAAKINYIFE